MEGDLLRKNGRKDVGECEGQRGGTVFFSPFQVWTLLAEGIVKEADKLACMILFLLFHFHSTVKAHFWGSADLHS